jgi:hypothetical protein
MTEIQRLALFKPNLQRPWHDGEIHMRSVSGKPLNRALDESLDCGEGECEIDFEWDGSSVPWLFRGLFPRHRHPKASCRHDKRCRNAKTKEERAFADKEFRSDVGKTSWKITSTLGYVGVRVGAFFGVGSNF